VDDPQPSQPYRVCGLKDGQYMLIVRVDTDRDGIFWTGDPSEEFFDGVDAPFIDVQGEPVERSVRFEPPAVRARVVTHQIQSEQGAWFRTEVDVRQILDLPIRVTLESGPPVPGPTDLHVRRFDDRDGLIAHLEYELGPFRPPAVPYEFEVDLLGGGSQRFAIVPSPHDSFATPVGPSGSVSQVSSFEWSPPETEPDFPFTYQVTLLDDAGVLWRSSSLDPARRTIPVEFEEAPPLESNRSYRWRIGIRSPNGDMAHAETGFSVSGD